MVIIPVNGLNERMSTLFKTPKHLLLYEGKPAILKTVEYMEQFGEVRVLANEFRYYEDLKKLLGDIVIPVQETDNVVDTINQFDHKGPLWIVDCDVVPVSLNIPIENTVYCFKNPLGLNQYSNFLLDVDFNVLDCNEKGYKYDFCGAGVYYFANTDFREKSIGCKSVSEVIRKCNFKADVTSNISRLGTLPDITGGFTGNRVIKTVTKTSPNAFNEKSWYEAYEDKNDIPRVLSCYDSTITLELVDETGDLNVFLVAELIEKYRYYKPMNNLTFQVYIDRIATHLQSNIGITNGEKLLKRLSYCAPRPSFAHGDLSVTNVLSTGSGIKLIDPLYSETMFGSYSLDQAKFLFSLKFYHNDKDNFEKFLTTVHTEQMDVLMASECVRVATYNKKFNFIAENLINEL